jgi:hypothetical protein
VTESEGAKRDEHERGVSKREVEREKERGDEVIRERRGRENVRIFVQGTEGQKKDKRKVR